MIELFLAFVLGAVVAYRVSQALYLISFRNVLKELGITDQQMRDLARKNGLELVEPEPEQNSELPVMEVKIEQHQGILFAFRKDTDQFLGQGSDRDALIQRLTENLSNVRLIISEENGAELLQKNNG